MSPHFTALENMYHGAAVNQVFAHQLSVEDGKATIRWQVQPEFFHAAGSLHGSGYFKLLDDAAFFACASLESEVFLLTTHFSLELMRKVTGGYLTAKGWVTSEDGQILEGASTLEDEQGRIVAQGKGTFARSRILLSSVEAYRL